MTREQVAEKVEDIIRTKLRLDEDEEVTPDTGLVVDLVADSLDIIEIIMALEDEFDMDIPDDQVAVWNSSLKVSALTDYIHGKLSG